MKCVTGPSSWRILRDQKFKRSGVNLLSFIEEKMGQEFHFERSRTLRDWSLSHLFWIYCIAGNQLAELFFAIFAEIKFP